MDARRIGLGLVAAGAAGQVLGLGLDAWLHAREELGNDGVLGPENLGHALFVGGLVAVAVGAVLALLGPRLYRGGTEAGPALRMAQFGAPAVAALLVAGGLVGASSSSLTGPATGGATDDGHAHAAAEVAGPERCDLDLNTASYYREAVAAGVPLTGGGGDGHAHDHGGGTGTGGTAPGDEVATSGLGTGESAGSAPATTAAPDAGHGEHKGPQAWAPLTDPAVCEQLRGEVERAAATAARYPTAADAQAAGYVMVTTYLPEIAAHWMNFRHVDGTFEVDEPEMLLYDGNGLDARIVGLSYYLVTDPSAPPDAGFAGGNTEYHRHIGLCVKGTLVVGGEGTTAEECAARGGVKNDGSRAWMAHAWVVPGCESPWGIFSAANPKLTPELGQRSGQGTPCSGSGTSYDDTPGVPAELAVLVEAGTG